MNSLSRSTNKMMTLRSVLAAGAVVLASASFAQAQSPQPALVQVIEIGTSETDPRYMFGLVADAAFGPDGHVYVVDALNAVVRAYDASGAHVRSFGRKGDGPGEFRYPTRLSVSPTTLTVFDSELRRATVFDHHGSHVETRSLHEAGGGFQVILPLRHGKWLGATTAIHTGPPLLRLIGQSRAAIARLGPDARLTGSHVVSVFETGTTTVDTVFRYDHGFIVHIGPRGVGMLPRYWGSGGGWATSGDSLIALVDGFNGAVRVLRVGRDSLDQVRGGRVPIIPERLTEQNWAQVADIVRRERGLAEDITLLGPAFRAQLGEPVFADDGTLWVRRIAYDPLRETTSSPAYYLVVPADGRPQYSVALPAGHSLRAVHGDRLLLHRRTELGADIVGVWRIESASRPGVS